MMGKTSDKSTKNKKKKQKALWRKVGLGLNFIQILTALAFMGMLFNLNVIPMKYMLIGAAIIVLITAYNVVSQFTSSHVIGKILSVLLSALFVMGCLYVGKTNDMLNSIAGVKTESQELSVVVQKDDPATSLSDAKSYQFGYVEGIDNTNMTTAISKINEKLGSSIAVTPYDDWQQLNDALNNQKIQAIILNEAYRPNMEEVDADFSNNTKIIDSFTLQTTVKLSSSDKRVNEEPFTVYVAGNDQEGAIASSGRNDVNIIATVNPKTRQILLLSTPRDYYIMLDNLQGTTGMDKLTHAGNFGIDGSITALSKLYGITVDYYVKVNFTGTINIVDALGGITINSDVAFTTTKDTSPIPYTYVVGENDVNGEQTLAFCRERHGFADGDFQRGRNEMLALEGLFNKVTSPAIITNYAKVMDSISDFFVTNMPSSTITALVKGILSDSTPWNIQTYSVSGTPTTKYSTWGKANLSVVVPDDNTVSIAKDLMTKISNGEVFDVQEYVDSLGQQ